MSQHPAGTHVIARRSALDSGHVTAKGHNWPQREFNDGQPVRAGEWAITMTHELVRQEDGSVRLVCTQKSEIEDMRKMIRDIHDHMFVGNGTPSFIVRLDRNERIINGIMVTLGTVFVAAVLSLCGIAFRHLFSENK